MQQRKIRHFYHFAKNSKYYSTEVCLESFILMNVRRQRNVESLDKCEKWRFPPFFSLFLYSQVPFLLPPPPRRLSYSFFRLVRAVKKEEGSLGRSGRGKRSSNKVEKKVSSSSAIVPSSLPSEPPPFSQYSKKAS